MSTAPPASGDDELGRGEGRRKITYAIYRVACSIITVAEVECFANCGHTYLALAVIDGQGEAFTR